MVQRFRELLERLIAPTCDHSITTSNGQEQVRKANLLHLRGLEILQLGQFNQGLSMEGQKRIVIREPLSGPDHEITFNENETAYLDKLHDDTLVIRLDVRGCELSRVMVDTDSSSDVLFYDAFKRMRFTKTLLKQERTSLIGFAGEITYSLGSIELAGTAGDVRKIVDFIVIDRPAPFNANLGRPWLYNMKAVPSAYHQCLKFPTPKGIETIWGSQKNSKTCYLASFKDIDSLPN
ncbi:hypothetical protein YC2023_017877 [Brassica napus]